MPTEYETTGTLYYRTDDGEYVPMTGIVIVNTFEDFRPYDYTVANFETDATTSFTLDLKCRHMKGLFDILFGRTETGAARRYVRSTKRQKEKERRRRLKERCVSV